MLKCFQNFCKKFNIFVFSLLVPFLLVLLKAVSIVKPYKPIMKHYMKPTFVLAGALLAASSFLNAGASAPTPVATDPVGYVSQTFDAGTHLVSAPLFSSIAAQGAAGTVAGADVDV